MKLLSSLAGWAIVLIIASDIFRSLLVPRASTRVLRLGPVVSAALFPLWQALADRISSREAQQTMRASLAPLMLVLSLVIWAAMLVLGYGLVFWGGRAGFAPRFGGVDDAIYAAGLAFTTLTPPLAVAGSYERLAVLGCSLSGLAIVTVVATFLISIQGGFGRRETLVMQLEAHVSLPRCGAAILETFAREQVVDRIGPFFNVWEVWSAEVALSHRAFPILLFFRSNDARCEWVAALGAVLDAAALVDAVIADASPNARAGAHFMLRTGAKLVTDLDRQLARHPPERISKPIDIARFRDCRARLARAGFAIAADERASLQKFVDRRAAFGPALAAIAARLRIHLDEV